MTEPTEKAVSQVTSESICIIYGVTVVIEMPAEADISQDNTKPRKTAPIQSGFQSD